MPTPQQLIDAVQDKRLDKLEGKPVVEPIPVPPPTPPPGEAPPPIGVFKPLSMPIFGAGPFTVGLPATRIGGVYPNALGVAGRRYRNGVLIPGATGADYVIAVEDVGQQLVFEECARTADGVEAWFKSAAVKPVAGAVQTGTGSFSVAQMIADMGKNDFGLRGYESRATGWYANGENTMGANPYFDGSQATWSLFYNNPKFKGVVCRAMLPWVVVFDGVNDAAQNTAFEIEGLTAFILSKSTRKWSKVGGPSPMSGMNYAKASNVGTEAETVYAKTAGGSVVGMPANRNLFWHGWWSNGRIQINPDDIAAVHARVRARLVVIPGKADDRAKAQLGVQIGADYYVDVGTTYSEGYAPSLMISRTKRITNDWQTFSVTTLKDGCSQNLGTTGITMAELRANPPPLT